MTERDRYFHYAVMSDYLRDAIKAGEIGERDAEHVALHLAETFRKPRHDIEIMPSARVWPLVACAVAAIAAPLALILICDFWRVL